MLSKKKFRGQKVRGKDGVLISEVLLREAISDLNRTTGIVLTPSQIHSFLNEVGLFNAAKSECDTILRERMADAMSEKLIGERWPNQTISESDFDGFINRVHRAAVSAGYEID